MEEGINIFGAGKERQSGTESLWRQNFEWTFKIGKILTDCNISI